LTLVPTSSGQARQKKSFSLSTAEGGRCETTSLFKNSRLDENWLRIYRFEPNPLTLARLAQVRSATSLLTLPLSARKFLPRCERIFNSLIIIIFWFNYCVVFKNMIL
jgi:hypothetical protein